MFESLSDAQEFNEAAVRAVLKDLTPRNLRIMLSSKRFKVCNAETVTCNLSKKEVVAR